MQLTVLVIQMQIDQGHGQYTAWQYAESVANIIAKVDRFAPLIVFMQLTVQIEDV